MNFNINLEGIAKMFEVLGNNQKARYAFYTIVICGFLSVIGWALLYNLADIIKAIAEIK